jgi:hypothetical protein
MADIFPQHASKLAGVWEMLSYDMYDGFGPDKELLGKRHGDKPFGRVVITSTGYISAHLTPLEKAQPLETNDTPQKAWQAALNDEVARIARPYSAYAGTLKLFERDEEDKKDGNGEWEWECVTEIALNPNLIGTKQYRRVTLEEGSDGKLYLTLSPRNYLVQEDGSKVVGVLRWEKVRES